MKRVSIGEVIPLPRNRTEDGRADDFRAVIPVRAETAAGSPADLRNVIPFARPRSDARSAPVVSLPNDAARPPANGATRERMQLAVFAALSLVIHCGLFAAFWREPAPLASVGFEVVSFELMLGATAPAGVAPTPGESEVNAAVAPDTEATEADKAEEKATEHEQTVQTAKEETAPEQKPEPRAQEARPEEPKSETAATPDESARAAPKPTIAMAESPAPDTPTSRPRETPPDSAEVTLVPQPEKPIEKKREPKPVQAAPPKPVKDAKPANEPRRIAAPTREKASKEAKASSPSTAANNVGIGRSSHDTNYRGIVWSHLARYKQSVGASTGTASVVFTIGGSGGVSGVRLARASGVAAIDQEVQAMVRRASPFPPPPGGRPEQFVVPVTFRSQ